MTKKLHEEHEEVMHYTNASGLYGIVASRTLWASHTSFLNDIEEVDGLFDRVLPEILKAQVERYFQEVENLSELTRVGCLLGIDIVPHFMKKIVDNCKEAESRAQDHYVVSFCTTDETWISEHGLLSQWRGYGLDGGYAIVFDSAGLESLLAEESKIYHEEALMLANAEYHMSEMSWSADEQILDLIRNTQESISTYLRTRDQENFDFDSASQLATICKHRGFEEEKEIRIVVSEPSGEWDWTLRIEAESLIAGPIVICVTVCQCLVFISLRIRKRLCRFDASLLGLTQKREAKKSSRTSAA
jgi:hypothetical protein